MKPVKPISVAPPLYAQSQILNGIIHFLVIFDHTNRGGKEFVLYLARKCWFWNSLILTAPFNNFVRFRFMVMELKMTGLRSGVHAKICPESRLPNKTFIFLDVLANILVSSAYFFKTTFALKPVILSTMNSINGKKISV